MCIIGNILHVIYYIINIILSYLTSLDSSKTIQKRISVR